MKKSIIFILLIISMLSTAYAQNMTLHFNNGSIDTVQLVEDFQMYFSDTTSTVARLQTPVNGARNVTQQPEFSWQHVQGKEFELLISGNNTFTDTLYHFTHIDTNSFLCETFLSVQTRYYWKVRIHGEELWTAPWYFNTYMPALPEKIASFALLPSDTWKSISIKTAYNSEIDSFLVVYGFDGISFSDSSYCDSMDMSIHDLNADSCYYMKIAGMNGAGIGPLSEVLAISVSTVEDPVLIVNGFDRLTAGNSLDFIRQHARAVLDLGYTLVSGTNEALRDGLLSFPFYSSLIYILGEESTVDETFNNEEQDIIEDYLKNGGNLFVSGAEIAWDLDYKGSVADKAFCHDYLHMAYAQDAPNNASGTYYNVQATGDTIFSDLTSFSFDNGTHGTYNVRYPDVIRPLNDAGTFLTYTACNAGAAGIVYQGVFPGGSTEGKVMVLGFPFETVYPESNRNAIMREFFQFVEYGLAIQDEIMIPTEHRLFQNYPNPFNPGTAISYELSAVSNMNISVYNMRGALIEQLINGHIDAGRYEIIWNASHLATGVYLCVMRVDNVVVDTRKMLLLK
ncbi:MAG: T9SS type A sorting domain-containing protein [Candidatus Marinimicrobia bacterium]|nr:T9SS type A sorting domain-containing protein [Candidatus Neomarinimicrobiota bacterium]